MPCVRASLNPLYVILFDVFKHLLLRKTDIFKTCWKSKFIKKKIWNALALKSKKIATKYIRENVYFGIIIFSCLSSTKLCLRFLLNCFVREIKGFYQSSLGSEVDFRDIMNVSPCKISWLKLKFRKTETQFSRWKSTDISLYHGCPN